MMSLTVNNRQEWEQEQQRREVQREFQNKLRERMLASELVEEFDLATLFNQKESEMTTDELKEMEEGMREWSQEYDRCIENPPKEGDILTTMDAKGKALLVIELREGSPPFIYGRVYVPEIVGSPIGWFLQDSKSQNFYGWKCILLSRARTEVIKRFGVQSEMVEVKSLKLIRHSQSGKSLLCEVHEYCDEKEEQVQEAEAQSPEVTAEELQ